MQPMYSFFVCLVKILVGLSVGKKVSSLNRVSELERVKVVTKVNVVESNNQLDFELGEPEKREKKSLV